MARIAQPLFVLLDWWRHRLRMRRWPHDQAIGRRGEDLAHRFLERAGFKIVARNFRPEGLHAEVDLVGWSGGELVFVEVKTRVSEEFGPPERAVSAVKEESLRRAARCYVRRSETDWENVRFDLVSVVLKPRVRIEHYPGAIAPSARRRL
jgi:putative endonuclease